MSDENNAEPTAESLAVDRVPLALVVWRRVFAPWPPLLQWVVLAAIAALLLSIVESGAVESPYNGF